jgi:plastocyanin
MQRSFAFAAAVLGASSIGSACAADFDVSQKNQAFSVPTLTIKAGDSVTFKNDDKVNHNVYSVSDPKAFDLGSEAPGKTQKVVFDKPGTVEVECAMHDNMHMKIVVTP